MGRKTITLPKMIWDKLETDFEGNASDAIYFVLDLGFRAMDNAEVMALLVGEDEEEEEDEDEDEEE